jgi:hypothetical protein
LLTLLAVEGTLVEINLTSNDRVLGVKDAEHPFLDYFSHDVPVALSTDDEGIARSNLTNEVSTRGAELQSRLPRAQNAGAQQRCLQLPAGINIAHIHGDLVRSLAAEGHEIAAHGFSHEDVSGLERNEELRRIARATEILADVAGGKPAGWFSLPRQGDRYAVGAVSPNTIDLLLEARLRLSATDWPTTSRIIGSATSRAAARCRRCPITTTSTTSSS